MMHPAAKVFEQMNTIIQLSTPAPTPSLQIPYLQNEQVMHQNKLKRFNSRLWFATVNK